MENEKLIKVLKEQDSTLYTKIDKYFTNITKEQLKDIILSQCLQTSNYITSPTILKHFYTDVIEDLEITWKEEKK